MSATRTRALARPGSGARKPRPSARGGTVGGAPKTRQAVRASTPECAGAGARFADDAPLLTLTPGNRLPPLSPIPARITPPVETEQLFARLATPLVRAGVLTLSDWQAAGKVPSNFVRQAWQRRIGSALRGAPDGMNVHLSLAPWAMMLNAAGEEVQPTDEAKLAITIDAGICKIATLEIIRTHWGETAARVVATALRSGLGRVINVWDPDDLEWIAEWWEERLEMYCDEGDEEARKEEEARIQEFAATQESVQRAYLPLTCRAELREALSYLPPGPVRRSAATLLLESRQPRKLWPNRQWERIQTGEEGYPTAAVLLTQTANDVVRHAYDELQEHQMNTHYSSPDHGLLLLDTSTPARLARGLRQLHRVLRTLASGEYLMHAVLDLADRTP